MTVRLPTAAGDRKSKPGRRADALAGLIQAMRDSALGGAVRPIARRRNVSESEVYKECDGVNKSPWESCCEWIEGALEAKDLKTAIAPLLYLLDHFLSPQEECELAFRRFAEDDLAAAMESLGRYVQIYLAATADGSVTEEEEARVERAYEQIRTALALSRRRVQAAKSA